MPPERISDISRPKTSMKYLWLATPDASTAGVRAAASSSMVPAAKTGVPPAPPLHATPPLQPVPRRLQRMSLRRRLGFAACPKIIKVEIVLQASRGRRRIHSSPEATIIQIPSWLAVGSRPPVVALPEPNQEPRRAARGVTPASGVQVPIAATTAGVSPHRRIQRRMRACVRRTRNRISIARLFPGNSSRLRASRALP